MKSLCTFTNTFSPRDETLHSSLELFPLLSDRGSSSFCVGDNLLIKFKLVLLAIIFLHIALFLSFLSELSPHL